MPTPIPTPKEFTSAGGTVPAVTVSSLKDLAVPEIAEGALRAYRHALRRLPDGEGTPLILKVEAPENAEYTLSVTESAVILTAADGVGINHALATLFQLTEEADGELRIPCCEISDRPDCPWRGLMLDLARCWHEPEFLFAAADLCWLYKMNRLQLHLNDDQGNRFPFRAFPKAISEEHYTEEDLKKLIAYCADRGIVIVPEIDAPGHATAFTKAYPEIFGNNRGLMCAEEKTFDALKVIYKEIADFFPDSPYIHVGGDEAAIAKWKTCEGCEAYRKEHGIADEHELYGHYVRRLTDTVRELGRTPMVWEGFAEECNGMIGKDVLVFAWESYYQLAPQLLKGGFTIINASWKPLYVVPKKNMWDPEVILDWEPNRWENFWEASIASKHPVIVEADAPILGGQMCVWGDNMQPSHAFAPRHDMIREVFGNLADRLPALAEKVWNPYTSPDKADFMSRMRTVQKQSEKIL